LHLAFEPAERAFQRLVIAEFDFCQLLFTCLSMRTILSFTQPLPDLTCRTCWDDNAGVSGVEANRNLNVQPRELSRGSTIDGR
jgi:hypothetical protein